MNILKRFNFDLGITQLLPQWKKLFSTKYLVNDINSGITVACVAIPLSLAIALASGVSPGVGLVTAIIGGIICAFFGGTPLAVSGPAAAMSILIANSVEKFGVKGLIFMCLMIGIMQLLCGILKIGKLSRFVPLPVIAAFTSGIGVIIIIGQLPRIFGLPQPDQSHIYSVIVHFAQYFRDIKPAAFILVLITLVIIRGLPRIFPKVPSPIVAVIVATLIANIISMDVALIGDIPRTLPMPHLPAMPTTTDYAGLLLTTFTIFMLACLETLLSSSAIDKLVKTEKHNPDQELIGQGLGNMAVSFFGGIPLTGVIARSAVNVLAGAKTRRSSIIHSVILLLTVFVAAPLISRIPIAALAGVLLSVAYNMIDYAEFKTLWTTARSEAIIYAITFFTIILVDLMAGVQVGILAASAILLLRATRSNLHITSHKDDAIRLSLNGALTFLSTNKVTDLEKELQSANPDHPVIIDFSNLTDLDSSGASAVIDLVTHLRNKKFKVYIKGLSRRFEKLFAIGEGEQILEECYLVSESLLRDKGHLPLKSFHGRLVHGVQKFHAEREVSDRRLLNHLALQQNPHTLFVTCSDSRIQTSSITSADPGELFIIRNVGNFIPPMEVTEQHSEIAALEFALTQLDITDIVVCGHSNCGAIKACMNPSTQLPCHLDSWIKKIRSQLDITQVDWNELAQQNVLNQITNLKQYPMIQERLAQKTLNLHAWFIDLEKTIIYEWDYHHEVFKIIGESFSHVDIPINRMDGEVK